MLYLIYFVVAFLATLIGSIVGLGGGIMMKPVLDLMGDFDIQSIAFLSTVTVFLMAIVTTTINHKKGLEPFSKGVSYLIIGSMLGGTLGSNLFNALVSNTTNDSMVTKIQAFCLILTLIFVLISRRFKLGFEVKPSYYSYMISGSIMGLIAAFLGIGGGPINMAILMLYFKLPVKKAAILSTVTVLFAQLSSIITVFVTTGIDQLDKSMLIVMVPAGIMGGLIGPKISAKYSDQRIGNLFNFVLLCLIMINTYTIIFK